MSSTCPRPCSCSARTAPTPICGYGSSRRRSSFRSPVTRCSGTAFVVGRADGLDVVRLETGLGVVPVTLERPDGGGEPVYGEMEQPIPTVEEFARRSRSLLAALGIAGDRRRAAADRGLPQRSRARVRRAAERGGRGRRSPRPRRARAARGLRDQLLRGLRRAGARRGCSGRRSGWPRTPPPARPPGRWSCTWPGTVGSSSGPQIEIEQGVEIGRRVACCRPGWRVRRSDRARCRGRVGGDRGAGRVPAGLRGCGGCGARGPVEYSVRPVHLSRR